MRSPPLWGPANPGRVRGQAPGGGHTTDESRWCAEPVHYGDCMTRRRLTPFEAMAVDGAVALLTGAFGVWRELKQRPDVDRLVPLPLGWYVAVQVVAAVVLLWRRRYPLGVGLVLAALCVITPVQPPAVATYSAAVHAENRRAAALVIAALFLGWAVGAQIWQLDDPITGPVVIAFGVVLGLYVRARRSLYDALVERAERAEREKQWLADSSVATERSRLASEMHDVLSHRLSLLILQAGALSVASPDPVVRAAAEELRHNGATALTELKEVFGGLVAGSVGTPAEPRTMSPGAVAPAVDTGGSVAQLVTGWCRGGGSASLSEQGRVGDLAPTVQRTVYRVVQEGLTNAAKHAPGATVRIDIACTTGEVTVVVHNGPPAGPPDQLLDHTGSGVGLSGLRQRVELLGGVLQAGGEPAGTGGFRLSARLPLERAST